MESQKRPATRISPGNAKKEAETILSQFASPDHVRPVGEDLCIRYSLSARHDVLDALASLLPTCSSPPSVEALLAFLGTQGEGLKPAAREDHVRLLLKIAASLREFGSAATAKMLLELLRKPREKADPPLVPELDEEAVGRVLTAVPGLSAGVTASLNMAIANSEANRDWLARWYRFLLPFLGIETHSTPRQLSSLQAGSLLDSLGTFDETVLPIELLFACPRLMSLADRDCVIKFLQTPTGTRLQRLIPTVAALKKTSVGEEVGRESLPLKVREQEDPASAPPTRSDSRAARGTERADFLQAVSAATDVLLRNLLPDEAPKGQISPEALVEAKQIAERATAERNKMQADLESLQTQSRDELAAVQEQTTSIHRENELLRKTLAEVQEEMSKWEGEADRREGELDGQFRLRQEQERNRLATLLSKPTRELSEHMQRVLEANRGDNTIRRMGVSFDSLQKNILRLLDEQDHPRISRELLSRPQQEPQPDEHSH